jgi:hypothetical protein
MCSRLQSDWKGVTAVLRTASRATAIVAALYCCGAGRMSAQIASTLTEVDRVRGVVINSVTREPVSRAVAYSPDNAFATMTDDRGRFEFVFRRPGSESSTPLTGPSQSQAQPQIASGSVGNNVNRPLMLMARKIGYLPLQEGVDISQINPALPDIVIVLVPESRIIGHVVIPGWDGSEKIQLQVCQRTIREGHEQWDVVGNASTRADGEFRIAGLFPGYYKLLTLEHPDRDPLTFNPRGPMMGYPPAYYPGASDFESAALIHLTPGETFQATLSPMKKPYYPVKVGFTQELASPQIEIKVWPQGRPGPGFSLGYSQRDGNIQGSLPDGTYSLLVASYGPSILAGMSNITVRGAALSGAPIALFQGSSITVDITEELQHPESAPWKSAAIGFARPDGARSATLRNFVQVNLMPEEQFSLAAQVNSNPAQNPEDESLLIENVRPGRYRVNAVTGFGYVGSISSGGTDLLREPLVVGAGAAMPPIEIALRDDGAEVDGTIESQNNSSTSVASGQLSRVVYLISMDRPGDQVRMGFADPSGNFAIPQVPPGSYRVLALDRQRAELGARDYDFLKQHESKIQPIQLIAEQKIHLRLPLITVME